MTLRWHQPSPAVAVIAALLAACSTGGSQEEQPPRDARDSSTPVAPVAVTESATTAAKTEPCDRLTAAELAAESEGLVAMGIAGPFRFSGRSKDLLCSEPGANGNGECEIVGNTVIKVEGNGEIYGLRTKGNTAKLLKYGPGGVACADRPQN